MVRGGLCISNNVSLTAAKEYVGQRRKCLGHEDERDADPEEADGGEDEDSDEQAHRQCVLIVGFLVLVALHTDRD
jgi:hypothetical protein